MNDYLDSVKACTPEEDIQMEKYAYCDRCMYAGGVCPAPGSCRLYQGNNNSSDGADSSNDKSNI